jgi:hypothetical protein
MNRRHLLTAFLAAPAAVKLAPFVRPAPVLVESVTTPFMASTPIGQMRVWYANNDAMWWTVDGDTVHGVLRLHAQPTAPR